MVAQKDDEQRGRNVATERVMHLRSMLLERADLRIDTVILLDRVQQGLPITDAAAKFLRGEGLMEARKPRYHVSAEVAATTGTQASYTRTRGLDKAKPKPFVLQHLDHFQTTSRQDLREIHLESEVCAPLAQRGWLYTEGDAAYYDRAKALYPPDLVAWVQESQPKALESLVKSHGAGAEATLVARVRKALDESGTLELLRFGLDVVGLRQRLALAQFKPSMDLNPELVARYQANRLLSLLLGHGRLWEELRAANGLPPEGSAPAA